jgi:hypothetical protein
VRRAKFAITSRQMHNLLGLPEDVRVVALHALHDPAAVHVVVEGEELPGQDVHGRDYAELAFHGAVEAPFLWHPLALHGVTWGDWEPGHGPDDAKVPTTPLSRSEMTTRLAVVLAEHGSAETAADARLLRALTNTVERLVAEGAVEAPAEDLTGVSRPLCE